MLSLRWVGDQDLSLVGQTRALCYAHAGKDALRYTEGIHTQAKAVPGEYLLAERDGVAVGTATALQLTMWVRGAPISCQGVAYVGAVKTERRRTAGAGGDPGVATAVMQATLDRARERGQIVSALMPFRASFYEHFGYGVMEHRTEWTIPLSILPAGSHGWRMWDHNDRPALARVRQSMAETGHCDVERSEAAWGLYEANYDRGFTYVCSPGDNGALGAWVVAVHESVNEKDTLTIDDWGVDSLQTFPRILGFLGSLKDQFYSVKIVTPVDWPINRWFREMQVPHRPVNHATADCRTFTRMQTRILNHKGFLETMHFPPNARGRVGVAVQETEGGMSRFAVEFDDGHAIVHPSDSAQFECTDRNWAAIACGNLKATTAVKMGLANEVSAGAAATLDVLAEGPAPFCREFF